MWKPFKTIREHWKKSIFFSSLAAYGVHLLDQRFKVNTLMRAYCEEAVKFGNQPWSPQRQLKHLTVILNPVANQRKGKKLFFNYAQPILNCAGIKLSIIETEHEGQAKDYMEVMGNTDGVIVVGGDGTIHEAITGYLRREDVNKKKPMPFGFIPTGKRNSGVFRLFQIDLDSNGRIRNKVEYIDLIGRLSMAIVKESIKPVDVVKVEGKEKGKPVFALHSFDFGRLRDYLESAESYWAFSARLKPYYPLSKKILFKNLSNQTIPVDVDIYYTKPCSGCAKCFETFKEPVEEEAPKRWWQSLIPRPNQLKPKQKSNKYEDLKNIINDECGIWQKVDITNLVNLSARNFFDNKITLNLHQGDDLTKTSLIKDGVNIFREKHNFSSTVNQLEARDISISLSKNQQITDDDQPKTEPDLWFNIDRENYEAQNVLLSLLPNRILVYGT